MRVSSLIAFVVLVVICRPLFSQQKGGFLFGLEFGPNMSRLRGVDMVNGQTKYGLGGQRVSPSSIFPPIRSLSKVVFILNARLMSPR